MVNILALVLHQDEQAVLAACEMALTEGAATKTHVLSRLGSIGVQQNYRHAASLEPKANVERYDGLRAQTAGGRNTS